MCYFTATVALAPSPTLQPRWSLHCDCHMLLRVVGLSDSQHHLLGTGADTVRHDSVHLERARHRVGRRTNVSDLGRLPTDGD